MGRHDWYRRTTWTPADETDFFHRLNRARKKADYLVIQAGTLVGEGGPELASVAIKLLDLLFHDDYEFKTIYASQAHLTRAKALLQLDRYDDACEAFEAALQARRAQPNVIDNAWLEYPLTVACRRDRFRYDRVLGVLAEFVKPSGLTFPSQAFDYFAALALISDDSGDSANARRWAANALAAAQQRAPFDRHPTFGVVKDLDSELKRQLEALAGPEQTSPERQ